ncbi:MAG TPA: IPTL-CTERM sorting domain-containing protein [Thermodesulfobacteriota bacterium]|nr:IPTL-CTERM sorting domain-containing protein [Thermodesulfobacteriota bacterium]
MVKRIIGLFVVIAALCGVSAVSARAGILAPEIPDGNCAFAILKIEPQIEGVGFDFLKNVNGTETQVTLFAGESDASDLEFVTEGGTISYTELPQEGWTLQDIQCLAFSSGVTFTQTDNSVAFTCVNPGEFSFAACVFINRVSADKIPTLSEWGMISAAAGLGLVGVFFAVRRRRLQAGNEFDNRFDG